MKVVLNYGQYTGIIDTHGTFYMYFLIIIVEYFYLRVNLFLN